MGVVPPTIRYQLLKFARKHKKTVAMAAAIAVILAVATVFSSYQAIRATRAEALTKKQVEKLAAINGWMNRDLLPQVNAWTGGEAGQNRSIDIKLKDAILQSAQRLSEDFKDHPEIEGEIRLTIGTALQALGMGKEAEENLRRAIELLEKTAGPDSTNTLTAQRSLGALISLQVYGYSMGRHDERGQHAGELLESVYECCTRLFGREHLLTLESAVELATYYLRFHRLNEADALFARLEPVLGRPLDGANPIPVNLQIAFLAALTELRTYQTRTAEARQTGRLTQNLISSSGKSGVVSKIQELVAQVEQARWVRWWDRDFRQAERILQTGLKECPDVVGDGYPTEHFLGNLAVLYFAEGNLDEWVHYQRMMAELNVRANRSQGGHGTVHALRAVSGYFLGRADWKGAASELRRQRTELEVEDGILLSMEAIASHLAREPAEAAARRRDYFLLLDQQLEKAAKDDNYTDAADRSAIHAMLTFPCTETELHALGRAVQAAFTGQRKAGWWIDSRAGDVLEGALAFRREEFTEAVRHLEPALAAAGNHRVNVAAHYILAMAHQKAGQTAGAVTRFKFAETLLADYLARGFIDGTAAEFIAMAMVLRDEAAALINPEQPLLRITRETLAVKWSTWGAVRRLVEAGDLQARRRNYTGAWTNYAAAIAHPAFSWASANEEFELCNKAFTTAWARGDADTHIKILQTMHEGLADGETRYLYQLAEVTWDLPADLKRRRESSQARRELEERGASPAQQFDGLRGGEDALILGMLAYREGNHEKALKFLQRPTDSSVLHHRVAGPAFAAMAHEKLGNHSEARRLLKQADERFQQMVIEPGEGMYPPTFSTCIMMEMVLKEADREIDPGVDNAPHVAALPDDRW